MQPQAVAGLPAPWYCLLVKSVPARNTMEGEMLADRFERLSMPAKLIISAGIVALGVWTVWSSVNFAAM
jgi:hypothetical protein